MPLTREAKQILERVACFIEREPARINIGVWFNDRKAESELFCDDDWCGTTGCIAGWVVALSLGRKSGRLTGTGCATAVMARNILGINDDQAGNLFYLEEWPSLYYLQIADLKIRTPEYAAVVAARIRFFIATDGTDVVRVLHKTDGQVKEEEPEPALALV